MFGLIALPTLWQFLTLLIWMIASIGIAPLVQYWFMQMDAYMIYPFVCVKCTTFWVNFIPNIILAYIWNPNFLWWGLVTASILAYMHHYSNKNIK